MGIAETWLAPGETVEVDGYSWFGVEMEGNNSRGGVGILIGDDFTVMRVHTDRPKSKGSTSVWMQVGKKGMPNTLVGVLYITPSTRNLAEFQQQALSSCQVLIG